MTSGRFGGGVGGGMCSNHLVSIEPEMLRVSVFIRPRT